MILPERNRKDLEDVPQEALEQMTFHFAKEMSEVLKLALDIKMDVTLPLAADHPVETKKEKASRDTSSQSRK